jgi:hypothetical protein
MAKTRKAPAERAVSDEEKRIREFTAEFLADWRADKTFRKNMLEDNDFYDGNQLSQEEIEALDARGQPPVTINRIKPKIDAVCGMQQGMRVDTKAYPAGQREQEASDVSEFFRSVEDDNDFDDHESRAFKDLLIPGRAWYEVGKRWDGLKSRHFVRRAYLEDIVPDRNSREMDHSDAERVHQSVWMDLKKAKAMFPHQAERLAVAADSHALDEAGEGENRRIKPDQYAEGGASLSKADLQEFADTKNRRVRIVKTYYRTEIAKLYFYHANLPNGAPVDVTDMDKTSMQTLRAAYPDGEVISQPEKKLHCYTFTWNAELEHKRDIRTHDKEAKFPLIMMEGYRERNTGVNFGLVRQMKDPQREVNKRRSKSLHLISVNRTIFEEGAFINEQAAREEAPKADAWIKVAPGSANKFRIENNTDLAPAHFQLLMQATQEIDAAGIAKELEGRSAATSGRDYQLRQQQAVQPIREIVANLRSGRRRVALYLFDEWVHEHPPIEGQEPLSKLDVVVEESPDTITLQQETFDKLSALAEKGIVPPDFIDLLIEVSPLDPSMKKRFMERIMQAKEAQMQALQAQAGGGAPAIASQSGVQ